MVEVAEASGALEAFAQVLNDVEDHRFVAREDAERLANTVARLRTCMERGDWIKAAQYAAQAGGLARLLTSRLEVALALERGARMVVNQSVVLPPHESDLSTYVKSSRVDR